MLMGFIIVASVLSALWGPPPLANGHPLPSGSFRSRIGRAGRQRLQGRSWNKMGKGPILNPIAPHPQYHSQREYTMVGASRGSQDSSQEATSEPGADAAGTKQDLRNRQIRQNNQGARRGILRKIVGVPVGMGGAFLARSNSPLTGVATAIVTATATALGSGTARADVAAQIETPSDPKEMEVYFGCGCFWHTQHEFIEMEKQKLGRSGSQLTSLTGYAGGKKVGDSGRVCYHNMRQIADYGRLGHAEVVNMRVPTDDLYAFAKRYFELFVKYELPGVEIVDRADPQDKGPEYRSLLGLPNGVHSPHFATIQKALEDVLGFGWKLEEGKGNEPDTLLKKKVYVYDSNLFPFHVAEMYHQFHDDFQSPPYGSSYNGLRDRFKTQSLIRETGCPEGMLV